MKVQYNFAFSILLSRNGSYKKFFVRIGGSVQKSSLRCVVVVLSGLTSSRYYHILPAEQGLVWIFVKYFSEITVCRNLIGLLQKSNLSDFMKQWVHANYSLSNLTLSCIMLKNGQTYFYSMFARFLQYVLPFSNIMHERSKWKLTKQIHTCWKL